MAVRAQADPALSDRKNAWRIAAAAVAAYLEHEKIEDEMERALAEARQRLSPDPYLEIAVWSDVAALFIGQRTARYEARECRQISSLDWQAEGRSIAGEVKGQLARRYRDFLR